MRTAHRMTLVMVVVSLAVTGPLNDGGGTSAGTGSASSQSGDGWTQAISIEVREGTKLAFDLSPDGRMIVFDLLGQLWLLPATGDEETPLTHAVRDKAEDFDPSFSADGKRVVFHSDRRGGVGLWLISAKEGHARRLTQADDISATWAPDGRQISFVRSDTVHILDVETATEKRVQIEGLPFPGIRGLTWTPDGTRLAFINSEHASSFRYPKVAWAGGRIWELKVSAGTASPLTAEHVKALAPAYSPDGRQIAFFSDDSEGRAQLWVWERSSGCAQELTDHLDTTPLRARWSIDGLSILYSADGRLWRIAASGGAPQEIPFVARLSLVRKRSQLRPVDFSPPGVERQARGHMGLALSPDGKRIAMIALGKLWVFAVGGTPRAVAAMPATAAGLSWSPDGKGIAWSAGPGGAEDLFATDVETGNTRRLSALTGREIRPLWSPDGRNIAFEHWETPRPNPLPRLRVMPARGKPVERLDGTREIAELASWWLRGEEPEWSPDSTALVVYHHPANHQRSPVQATLVPLQGEPRPFERFPEAPTFFRWREDGSVIYVQNDMLWRARFRADLGMVGQPTPISDDPALYASAARDGSILYVSGDGLRLRRSDGRLERLGWPLTYRTPAPERLVIRNVRIIDGTGAPPTGPRDILVEGGRIVRIAPVQALDAGMKTQVIEGDGRTVIPGLMDLHVHISDDALLPAFLYNGVTTVREVGSPIARTAALRDAVEAGVRPGPRIVFGAFMFWSGIGVSGEFYQTPGDDAGFVRAMALARGFGADYIKQNAHPPWAAEVKITEHAHAAGLPVSGHCTYPLPLVAAGMDGQEHTGSCSRIRGTFYDDIVQLLRAADLWVVPTIIVSSFHLRLLDNPTMLDQAEANRFLTPYLRHLYERLNPAQRPSYERTAHASRLRAAKLHRAGVRIAAGTDLTLPWALHWELEELVRSGMSPLEAIHAATGVAARVLGADAEIGTIEDGKWADLVILDADPLQDIQNTKKIWMVIKGGEIVNREALRHWIERETIRCDSQEHLQP